MNYDTVIRQLRIKHHIRQNEFARCAGISISRLKEIENCEYSVTAHQLTLLQRGMENLLAQRAQCIKDIQADYEKHKNLLLSHNDLEV